MRLIALLVVLAFAGSGLVVSAQRTDAPEEDDEVSLFARMFAAWDPKAELEVLEITTSRTKIGGYGDEIEADPGYVFHHVRVVVRNTGTVSLPVSTWHFSATDELGYDVPAETSMAHHDFDGQAVRKNGARQGLVIFELPEGAQIRSVVWQGELGFASVEVAPGTTRATAE